MTDRDDKQKDKQKDNSLFQGDGPIQKAYIIKDGETTTLIKQGDSIAVLKGRL